MKINKLLTLIIFTAFVIVLSACSAQQSSDGYSTNTVTASTNTQATSITETVTATQAVETTENVTEKSESVVLNNTYTTRFSDVNKITYPTFTFNYPDNWEVVEEEVTADREIVTLQNNNDAEIAFSNFILQKILTLVQVIL